MSAVNCGPVIPHCLAMELNVPRSTNGSDNETDTGDLPSGFLSLT